MKRLLIALTASAIMLGITTLVTGCSSKDGNSSGASTSSYDVSDINGVLDFYEKRTEEEDIRNEISLTKQKELLNLPEETLKSLSTEDLVEAILNYPYLFDWRRYTSCKDGIAGLNDTVDVVKELQNRSDAASVLLKRYSEQKVYSPEDMSGEDPVDKTELYRIEDIEILITQDYVMAQMTEDEKKQFFEIAKQKQVEKDISGIYMIDPEMIPDVLENLE